MIYLTISNGDKVSLDNEDYERISRFTWSRTQSGSVQRKINQRNPVSKRWKTIAISIANEVMQSEKVLWDHIDRDPLNNIKKNLRFASSKQNAINSSKMGNCSSKYKGVVWDKSNNKWKVRVGNKNVGNFASEIDAAKMYNEFAVAIFGEFAVLNTVC